MSFWTELKILQNMVGSHSRHHNFHLITTFTPLCCNILFVFKASRMVRLRVAVVGSIGHLIVEVEEAEHNHLTCARIRVSMCGLMVAILLKRQTTS
jgi:hypothetical protein